MKLTPVLILLAGCSSMPEIRWKNIAADTASHAPAECRHPGVIWSAPETVTTAGFTRIVRERKCAICGFAEVRSEFAMQGAK